MTNRSPNFDSRQCVVDMLVLHYTGMDSFEAALKRLCDPQSKVSSHYLVPQSGEVVCLVSEADRAWHAGISRWRGRDDVNSRSIGIEIVNPGHEHGYRDFPAVQMEAIAGLCQEILERHPDIEPRNVVGHSDIAPDRKEDPGERFDWRWLAGQGIGLWPEDAEPVVDFAPLRYGDCGEAVVRLRRRLAAYGWPVEPGERFDTVLAKVVVAFQRHFRPGNLGGVWDSECEGLLAALLRMI